MAYILTIHLLAILWSYRFARSRDHQTITGRRSFRMAHGPTARMDVEAERGGCALSSCCTGQYRRVGQGLKERVGLERGSLKRAL